MALCSPKLQEGCSEVMCELQYYCPQFFWVSMLLSTAGVQENDWCCTAQSHTIPCPHCSVDTVDTIPCPQWTLCYPCGRLCVSACAAAGTVNHCSQRLYAGRRQPCERLTSNFRQDPNTVSTGAGTVPGLQGALRAG